MLFASTTFIFLFLPCVLAVYYGLLRRHRKAQNYFLTIASLFFYAWGEPKFVLVMIGSIIANWLFGLWADHSRRTQRPRQGKLVILLTVVCNLSLLFVYKYLAFTIQSVSGLFSAGWTVPKIALPIGISFFTFQAMSYVLDVYRGQGQCQRNIMNVGLYISLFPQLIAGPIVRYETVAQEIEHRKETADDFYDGFARFVVGFGKKVLLANSLSLFADAAFGTVSTLSVASAWLGAISYAFQIFFDFSGYSDMAIGLGKMFGFHFLENFNYPYISRSITEFWRRWHISLGSWFRDYVYIPLGGSRVKKPRLIFNLFVVWLLTGTWHGANWTFIAWGLLYFLLLTVEKLTGLDKRQSKLPGNLLRWCYSMLFVLLGWVLFRADSLTHAVQYIATMFGLSGNTLADAIFLADLRGAWVYLLLAAVFSTPIAQYLHKKEWASHPAAQILHSVALVIVFLLALASVAISSHNPFIYFNF